MSAENQSEMRNKKLPRSIPVNRHDLMLRLCEGKTVLDLGCADYPMTEERYRKGELLFAKLRKVAKNVTGVDNSLDGLETLRSLGFDDLVLGNAEELGELEMKGPFDVILAGELIEHLFNVGRFFEGVKQLMSPHTILIISVPNAFAIKRFLRVLAGSELVNKDHAYYFSQANIELLTTTYGLHIRETYYYLAELHGRVKNILFAPLGIFVKHLCPYVSDHLIFLCELTPRSE